MVVECGVKLKLRYGVDACFMHFNWLAGMMVKLILGYLWGFCA